jgi:hypothetical protein
MLLPVPIVSLMLSLAQPAAQPPSFRLLVEEQLPELARSVISLDPQTRARLIAEPSLRAVRLTGLRAGDRALILDLDRFPAVAPDAAFEIGLDRRALPIDPERVALFRGRVAGDADARAFIAIGPGGVIGQIDLGGDQGQWLLGARDASRLGLQAQDLAIVRASGFGSPPLVEACSVVLAPCDHADGGGGGSVAGFGDAQRRVLDVAIETDHEYFSLFGDPEAAADYAMALVGAISDIYQRDLSISVRMTYLRLWDTPEDLFNEPNPLVPFRDWWNANMTDVPRDVAQLLTGRRNLPYGGVAYLSALCGEFAYSVSGYLNGSFTGPDVSAPGNWDLTVTAHEFGHNCGTLHTHDYGLDSCNAGSARRGGLMSYCHIVSGGVSNVDPMFETPLRGIVRDYIVGAACVLIDCDGNGVADADDILSGTLPDVNGDGIPDGCQDCDGDGVLDPEAIALGGVSDLDGDGVPDACQPDCNGNGVPDSLDIASGASVDLYLDGVPDECEVDCDGDGTSDLVQINQNMTLDVDRDRVLDACQDCDGDGVNDLLQLAGGLNLWVAGAAPELKQFHGRSGAPTGLGAQHGVGAVSDVVQLPDGRLAVAGSSNSIALVDPVSGAGLGDLVASGSGGLSAPGQILLAAPNRLLVASSGSNSVLEYRSDSGAFVRVLVAPGPSHLVAPWGMTIVGGDTLLVTSQDGSIRRFDAMSGAALGLLVPGGSGGLFNPRGLHTLDDGSVLVAGNSLGLLRFDGQSGAFLGRWDQGGVSNGFWGLREPWVMRRAADGKRLLVSNAQGSTTIHAYELDSGLFLRTFYVLAQDITAATGFVELPPSPQDCNLNLIPDPCDIASGRSADADGNGVPDECQSLGSPDLNGDGTVDGADLGLLLSAWGPCVGACPADLDGDGMVGGSDLGLLLGAI